MCLILKYFLELICVFFAQIFQHLQKMRHLINLTYNSTQKKPASSKKIKKWPGMTWGTEGRALSHLNKCNCVSYKRSYEFHRDQVEWQTSPIIKQEDLRHSWHGEKLHLSVWAIVVLSVTLLWCPQCHNKGTPKSQLATFYNQLPICICHVWAFRIVEKMHVERKTTKLCSNLQKTAHWWGNVLLF